MKSILLFRVLFLAASLLVGQTILRAEDLGAVKARMEQRQGSVDALKARKTVGENNRGFLEARATLAPGDEKLVADENGDRRTAYAALAARTGTTADEVGRVRAQKIAATSKRGVLIQAADGKWSEKS